MEQVKVGVSTFETSYKKTEYFKIEAGKPNIYRILPPMFSLAEAGKWAQYYSTHSIWLDVNGKRKPYHFQCILEKDRDKNIVQDCPFCTAESHAKTKLESVKSQLTQEQVKAFERSHVEPFQAKKMFYMNVVNQANSAGILDVGFKAYEALRNLLREVYNSQNMDATAAVNGIFLNFKKNQAYKGDRNTSYSVELYQEMFKNADGSIGARYLTHTLTPDVINKLASGGARDLGTLYQEISKNDIESLARGLKSNDNAELQNLCEKIFAKPTKTGQGVGSIVTSIPGTNAVAVNPYVSDGGSGFDLKPVMTVQPVSNVVSPNMVTSKKPELDTASFNTTLPWEESSNSVTASSPVPSSVTSGMSDDFFKTLMEG